MPAWILIAEDDPQQAEVMRRYLERDGHLTAVAHDGRSAIEMARRRSPDLLVLDLMLPELDGLEVCRVLRSENHLPVIMLTARTSEDDLLLGLAVGADDYLTKPYSPRELVARVRTVLRRAAPMEPGVYRVGDLLVDVARREVHVGGEPVELTPGEFNILSCLAAAPGRTFTRQLLLERVSSLARDATIRAIDVHVWNLRRKIEPEPIRPRYLLTVYGVGYKLAEHVGADAETGDAP